MRRPNPTIWQLMILVAFVALVMFFGREENAAWLVALALPCAVLSPYVLQPIRLYRTNRMSLDPELEPIDPRGPDVPPLIADVATRAIEGLASLGFSIRYAYSIRSNPGMESKGFTLLFEDRTGIVAKLLLHEFRGKVQLDALTIVFATEYADGSQVQTTSTKVRKIFPPIRESIRAYRFPEPISPPRLLEVHRAILERDAAGKERVDHLRGGLLAYHRRITQMNRDRQVDSGYYRVDDERSVLRPTPRGAAMMAWRLMPPFKQLLREHEIRKARRWLRELGLTTRLVDG